MKDARDLPLGKMRWGSLELGRFKAPNQSVWGAYPAANVPGMYLKYCEISEVVGLHPVFRII